jgi:hypothetical protein
MANYNAFQHSSPPNDCVLVWQTLPPTTNNIPEPNPNNFDFGVPSAFERPSSTLSDKIRGSRFCMFLIMTLIVIIVIIALLLGFYFGNTPHPHLHVYAVNVCPFTISSSYITAQWDFGLLLKNPHGNSFYYSLFDMSLFYKSKFLSGNSIEPFVQPRKDQRVMEVKFAASSMYVEENVMEDIISEKNTGVVKFDLRMKVDILTRRWFYGMENVKVDIICEDVMVVFPSNRSVGSLLGNARQCKVKKR